MPELPDIELYLTRIRERTVGERLERLRFFGPFVLRSVGVTPSEFEDRSVVGVLRLGKRIVLELEGDGFILIHLMIAGRLQWHSPAPPFKPAMGKIMLASLELGGGRLSLVEVSSKKRAGVWLIRSRSGLDEHRRAGLDVFQASPEEFRERLQSENRTVKRALTNPTFVDGVGNAYSDEILFEAKLSPVRLTHSLADKEMDRLLTAARKVLVQWTARPQETIPKFPKPSEVTAFRPEFAVHGKFGQPCPQCGAPVQRIVYAENQTNYCANCQNEGRLLADRSLSRLLKGDWPATLKI